MRPAVSREEQVLRDVSAVLCEFLEVAVHCILFVRGVYPAELFQRRRKYNMPVRQSRHQGLNEYIERSLVDAKLWMERGHVSSVVVAIEDAGGMQLERFVFELDLDTSGQHDAPGGLDAAQAQGVEASAHDVQGLEDCFKQALLKINCSDSWLKPLGKETTFCIYVHTDGSLDQPTDEWETLDTESGSLADGSGHAGGDVPTILPLKSVTAGAFGMQLYVQHATSAR